MSRFYSMELIVEKEGLSEEEFKKIERIYAKEWVSGAGFKDEEGAMFSSEGALCGGESEEEAHDRVRDAVKGIVPDCSVTTRWTYLEELPYEEYTD